MPTTTKVRRGIGLLLLGGILWLVAVAVSAVADGAFGPNDPVGWAVILLALAALVAGLGCALAGLVLLLWGLLRG